MMSRSPLSYPGLIQSALCLTVVALSVSWASAQTIPLSLPDRVPRFVEDAARKSVSSFVLALAAARIPTGAIAFESDLHEPESGLNYGEVGVRPDVPRETALAAFRTHNPGYELEQRNGVLLIRARELDLVVGPVAERRTARFRVDGVPLPAAFNEAMRIANPAIPARGGIVGSILASADEPPFTLLVPLVTLHLTNASFLEALNEIVKNVAGSAWILSRHGTSSAGYFTLAFRGPQGTFAQFHDELE